ncbi:MAG TPA: nucleoside-diphosphate sugar epimerase/dehydratase [Alkalispirochaeta sp.]|nr:nucleoside-diphosphate sugar epimerase/dehydratase [Alkalispirochaeta sp.]
MSASRIYIIGAGFAGRAIAREILDKGVIGRVVAFLDDDTQKIGTRIDDVPVLGPIDQVVSLVEKTPADEALIAIPSASREDLRRLHTTLRRADFARIRILPTVSQIVGDDAHFIQTRQIDPQDLLGRTPVNINLRVALSYLRGRRVLITGAGGSIGSELARQLLSGGAERLYLLGHGENSIYEIEAELRLLQEEGVGDTATIVPIIGDLTDSDYVWFLLRRLKADVIFHTAAYKHVPMMEANPVAAIQNNVFGTLNLIEAAEAVDTGRLVLISTDKAVRPSNIYGVSKNLAESLFLLRPAERDSIEDTPSGTVVRFGNVLGSRGSILPLFRRQIEKGGPVTITDATATRFFMTIPEAVSLVLQTAGVGTPGELFVLDMGEPINIRDLAEQMIRFFGFTPDADIPVQEIGLRPGEKLTETLFDSGEVPEDHPSERIVKVRRNPAERSAGPCSADQLQTLLHELRPVCFFDQSRPGEYRNRWRLREVLTPYYPDLLPYPGEPEY